VIGCANLKNLRNEGFDARLLDTNNKGCLKIEDIVNFVNTYTAHTYRSNDIGTVFRRLQLLDNGSNPERIEYPTFMQAFTM
jgi:ABC-type lipoprotein export system ATPase subunit